MKILSFVFCIAFVTVTGINAQQKEFTKLTGPYLGQVPPGKTPELFAPGIISVDENFEHSAAVFSPDGKEVFWCTNVGGNSDKRVAGNLRLYTMKMVDGYWTSPKEAQFVKEIYVERPVFSHDGNKLFLEFSKSGKKDSDDFDIYLVEKEGESWSEPIPVSPLINTTAMERLFCVTADGSIYFARNPFTRNEEVFVSRCINGVYSKPEKLGKDFNSDDYEGAIIISPNEDYMLISHSDVSGIPKFSISFKDIEGNWSRRIKIPFYCGGFIALSPDGKYLFFMNEGIWWVNTSFIDELKPKNLK